MLGGTSVWCRRLLPQQRDVPSAYRAHTCSAPVAIACGDAGAERLVRHARKAAAAAREAHGTVHKALAKLTVQQREPIEAKLATLDPMMEKLAAEGKRFQDLK